MTRVSVQAFVGYLVRLCALLSALLLVSCDFAPNASHGSHDQAPLPRKPDQTPPHDRSITYPINDDETAINQQSAYFGSLYKRKIPLDATKTNYDEKLFAMIGGYILDENNQPVADAKATILNHSEYGSVKTNSKGFFRIPTEGGKRLTVRFSKEGYLSVDRELFVLAQDWSLTPDVTLVKQDGKVTLIDLNDESPKTHQSSIVTDDRGYRSALVVFNGVNKAIVT
ncbi:MAG: carboxypeptidase-like regulatory domain-containing protein, partial [Helicobacteraceae bacterium]|nr:carboxypeptidase-like regulatory domain-containing protein [Helicobacteraceae bacterium]